MTEKTEKHTPQKFWLCGNRRRATDNKMCKYCGKPGLRWGITPEGKGCLHDENGIHYCREEELLKATISPKRYAR